MKIAFAGLIAGLALGYSLWRLARPTTVIISRGQ